MPGYDPTYSQWCPPELTAAAEPLRRTGEILRQLSDDSHGIEQLAVRGPSPQVMHALNAFVDAWEMVLWQVSGDASSLGDELRLAAQDYLGSEADLQHRLALDLLAHPDHEGRER